MSSMQTKQKYNSICLMMHQASRLTISFVCCRLATADDGKEEKLLSYEAQLTAPFIAAEQPTPVCAATDAFCDNYFHERLRERSRS
jgi:hypothetical protein